MHPVSLYFGLNPFSKDVENLRAAAARELYGAVYHYFIASREALNEPFEEAMEHEKGDLADFNQMLFRLLHN